MISQYLGIDSYHCKYSADAEAEKSIQSIYERKKR